MQIHFDKHSRAFTEEKRLWVTRNSMKIGSCGASECVKWCFVYSTSMNAPQRGFMCGSVFFVLPWLETVCVSCSLLNATLFFPCCGSTCHFSLLPVEEHTHAHTHMCKKSRLFEESYSIGGSRVGVFAWHLLSCSLLWNKSQHWHTFVSFCFNHLTSHHTVFVGPFFSEWRLTAPLISPPSSGFSFLWT